MKKILCFILLISVVFTTATGQQLTKVNGYGFQYKRFQVDTTFTVPSDTLATYAGAHIAYINGAFYGHYPTGWDTLGGGGDNWGNQIALTDLYTINGTGIAGDPLLVDTSVIGTRFWVENNFLASANNLSELSNPSLARANLGFPGGVVVTEFSITGDGISTSIKLANDENAPGINKVYGTDASGVKGWKDDPAGGGGAYTTEQVQDDIGAALSAEFTYNDVGNSISINSIAWSKITGTPTLYTDEDAQDAVGDMVNSTITYTDGTPLLGVNLSSANVWLADQSGPSETYAVGWNGSNEYATKNDIYDKIESLVIGGGYTTEQVQDDIGAALSAEFTYNDGANSIAINSVAWSKITGAPTMYTDENAQDAVGAMINSTLSYVDATPLLGINLGTANTWTADITVPNDAYDATGWNGNFEVPTKDAIRDKFESLIVGGGYSDEEAQDAVGTILSSEFTYADATPSISINVIAATKIGDGSVSNAEFAFINTLTSNAQTQLNGKQPTITTGTTAQYFRGDLSLATFPTIPTQYTDEMAQDAVGSILAVGEFTYNDVAGTIAINQIAYSKIAGTPTIPTQYTDEMAQDATGAMVNSTLVYVDATPTLGLNLATANTWTADQSVPEEAYNATTWNASTEVPTKNAVRDQFESLSFGDMLTTATNNMATTGRIVWGASTSNSAIRIANLEFQAISSSAEFIGHNVYYDGANVVHRATGALAYIEFSGSTIYFKLATSASAGATASPSVPFGVTANGGIIDGGDYMNFGSLGGSSGYGFWDDGGIMKWKNAAGSWAVFGSGTTETADNGLSKVSNDIVLGGTLNTATTINAGSSYSLALTGAKATGTLMHVTNSSGGTALLVENNTGAAIQGTSSSSQGGSFSSTFGVAVLGSSGSLAGHFYNITSATNTSSTALMIGTQSTGTVAANYGVSAEFNMETASGSQQTAGLITTVWTDPANATRSAQMNFGVVNSASAVYPLSIFPNGTLRMVDYGDGNNVASPTYFAGWDSDGDFVEIDPSSVGGSLADGDKQDITVSASGLTWQIDAGAVGNSEVASGIDAVKLASGGVTNTEFEFINTLTSNAQTQIDAKLGTSLTNGNVFVGNGSNIATSRKADYYNVLDYGLVGNGSTNNDAAMAALMTVMGAANGGVCYFPAGVYVFTSQINVPDNVTLLGVSGGTYTAAQKGSVLRFNHATNKFLSFNSGTPGTFSTGNVIRNLTIKNVASTPTAGSAIFIAYGGFEIYNVEVYGFYDGIVIDGGNGWSIRNSSLYANRRYQLKIRNTVNSDMGDFTIDHCFFGTGTTGSSPSGIYWNGSGGFKMTNCKINGSAGGSSTDDLQYGIILEGPESPGTADFQITNTSIENYVISGIYARLDGAELFRNIIFTNIQFATLHDNNAPAIDWEFDSYTIGNGRIVVDGFTVNSWGTVPDAGTKAFAFTNVDGLNIGNGSIGDYTAPYFSTTGCTDVYIEGSAGGSLSGTEGYVQQILGGILDDSPFFVDANGNIGMGTTSPDIVGYGSNYEVLTLKGTNGGALELASSLGDVDALETGYINFAINGNTTNKAGVFIFSMVRGSTAGNRGADLVFQTKPDNSSVPVTGLTITNTQNVLQKASSYHNWGTTSGSSGYGFWDDGGTLKWKNSGGTWAIFGGGGGGSQDLDDVLVLGNTSSTGIVLTNTVSSYGLTLPAQVSGTPTGTNNTLLIENNVGANDLAFVRFNPLSGNAGTAMQLFPSGTGHSSGFQSGMTFYGMDNNPGVTDHHYVDFSHMGTEFNINTASGGAATAKPINFQVNGTDLLTINPDESVEIKNTASGLIFQEYSYSTDYYLIMANGITPNSTNYAMIVKEDGTFTYLNSLTETGIAINGSVKLAAISAGVNLNGRANIYNSTAPVASVTDGVILYSEDVSSSAELKVRDEAGNITTLSPHNFSGIPGGEPSEYMAWSYYSERGSDFINTDMALAVRTIENQSREIEELKEIVYKLIGEKYKKKEGVKLVHTGKVKDLK